MLSSEFIASVAAFITEGVEAWLSKAARDVSLSLNLGSLRLLIKEVLCMVELEIEKSLLRTIVRQCANQED